MIHEETDESQIKKSNLQVKLAIVDLPKEDSMNHSLINLSNEMPQPPSIKSCQPAKEQILELVKEDKVVCVESEEEKPKTIEVEKVENARTSEGSVNKDTLEK